MSYVLNFELKDLNLNKTMTQAKKVIFNEITDNWITNNTNSAKIKPKFSI